MIFERFDNCKDSIQDGQLNLDAVLDLLNCVIDDAKDITRVENFYDIPSDDASDVAQSLLPFINVMVSLIDSVNTDELMSIQRDILNSNKMRLEEMNPIFENLAKEIEKKRESSNALEEQKVKLEAEKTKLEKERGHLLHLEEECDAFQAEIDRLNDPYLDELAQQKSVLEAKVKSLKEKETKLLEELHKAEEELSATKDQYQNSEAELAATCEENEKLANKIEENEKKKSELEKDNEKRKREVDCWKEEIDQLNAELNDKTNQISSLVRACDSLIKKDDFVKDVEKKRGIDFFLLEEDKKDIIYDGGTINDIKDLSNYVDSLMRRIDTLTELYKRIFSAFQEKSNKILEENSQNS